MKNKILFWTVEAILFIAAYIFAFGRIRVTAAAVFCIGFALFLGIYRLIKQYSTKNPKRAKIYKTALVSLAVLGLAVVIAVEIPIIYAAQTDNEPEADYVIVLGAGVNGSTPSHVLRDRLAAAKDYLDKYPNTKAVLSGGQGSGEFITEAECMRRWLEDRGVAPERLLLEEQSTSTFKNLQYSFEVIRADGGDPENRTAILSSEFHLFRAKHMARELGSEPVGIAAETTNPFLKVSVKLVLSSCG